MKYGAVFEFAEDYMPVPGCTISEKEQEGVTHFSLAEGTSISAESYPCEKVLIMQAGSAVIKGKQIRQQRLKAGEVYVVQADIPVGIMSSQECVYTELYKGERMHMNSVLKAGKVFELKDLVPYQTGRIVNMDLVDDDHLKYVVMSFDAGQALQEHAAPGDAVVTALDGEGIIGYEGKEYVLHAGESFRFAKNGRHYVRAEKQFKMSLLLTLE